MNSPTGVELPSVTVAVQEVVPPTGTVSGEHMTEVAVEAADIDKESSPELAEKSLVPAKFAVTVVEPSPTVSPETVTVQEFVVQISEEIETAPDPGEPKDHVNNPTGVELPSVTVAVQEVVAPTTTVFGEQMIVDVVDACVIARESIPELTE